VTRAVRRPQVFTPTSPVYVRKVGLCVLARFTSFDPSLRRDFVKVRSPRHNWLCVDSLIQPSTKFELEGLQTRRSLVMAPSERWLDAATLSSRQVLFSLPTEDRLDLLGLGPAPDTIIPLPGPHGALRIGNIAEVRQLQLRQGRWAVGPEAVTCRWPPRTACEAVVG
jgi:hypothetical protein